MDVVDNQARVDVGKAFYRIGIIETVLWGEDKTNGIRSTVRENTEKIQELTEGIRHYMDADREQTCLGLKEFEKRDAFKAEINQEVGEVKVANINSKTQVIIESIRGIVGIVAPILTLVGIIWLGSQK